MARVTVLGALIVTPAPAAIVVAPAPSCCTISLVPIAKATEAFGGTVRVLAEALSIVMCLEASVRTKVYVDSTLYALVAPDTGSNTVEVTHAASTSWSAVVAMSYTGVKQSIPTNYTTNSATTSSLTTSLTTSANSWLAMSMRASSNGVTNAGTGATSRYATAGFIQTYDSNGALSAGSNSMTSTGATQVLGAYMVELEEYVESIGTITPSYTVADSKQNAQDNVGSYSSARNATTSSVFTLNSGINNILHNSRIGGTFYVRRADLQFDTSSIPDGAIITAAKLVMRAVSSGSSNANTDTVVALNNTDNGDLSDPVVSEDMDDYGTVSIGSEPLASYTGVSTDVDLVLSDFTAINKTGVTRIGLRLQKDIDNTTPTGSNVLRVDTSVTCELVVDYGVAVEGGNNLSARRAHLMAM